MTADNKVQRHDFRHTLGDDFERVIAILDDNGQPQNIEGWTFFLDIFESYAAKLANAEPLVRLSMGSGFTVPDPTAGQVSAFKAASVFTDAITIAPPAHASNSAPEKYCVHDLLALDADGRRRRAASGLFVTSLGLSESA